MYVCLRMSYTTSSCQLYSVNITPTLKTNPSFSDICFYQCHVFTCSFPTFPHWTTSGKFPFLPFPPSSKECKFKHIIYFNSQLFRGKESGPLCGRSRNYQSLSMRDRCTRCLGAKWLCVIFVVLRLLPARWNDNRGLFWRFYGDRFLGLWLNAELYQSAVQFVHG